MADRNLLHKSKLDEFKLWLDATGHEWRPSTADYQLMQVKWGTGWQVIYAKDLMIEHVSVPNPLIPLVRSFIREMRKKAGKGLQPPAGYTAEELERDNPFNAWMQES